MTTERENKRPWLAAMLGVLSPGLGHIYLRLWGRALLWFLMALVSVTVLATGEFPPAIEVGTLVETLGAFPSDALLVLLGISYLGALDAYLQALRSRQEAQEEGVACPACGKPRDEELDFCEWCAEPIEG